MRRRSIAIRTGVAFCALALALSPVLALEAGAGSGGWVPVGQGVSPASLPGATAFGSTPASTPETVSFILNEPNKTQLEADVEQGVSQYLSVSEFAQQYGQSQSNINALTSYLAKFGIKSTVYADNVDVSTSGTAGDYDAALSVQQDQYHVPAFPGQGGMQGIPAQTVHGATTAPELPSQLASFVLAVLGLSNYAPFASNAVHADTTATAADKSNANPCIALAGLPDGCNTAKNFEQNYGLTPLESNNAGAGQTLAIVTLAALDPGAPQYYWSNVLGLPSSNRSVTVENIDGGPGAPSDEYGSGETDLDVEQSGGVAPGANVIVYQAPNTDPGFADSFFTAASQNIAGSVSCSWGESETVIQYAVATGVETPAYVAAFDEAFLELAAQGQATFVSAGDAAAYDASEDLGTTNLSVDAPGDSPYVTSSGGTTLPWSGSVQGPAGFPDASTYVSVNVSQQRAWGWDYLWPAFSTWLDEPLATTAEELVVGGGGGFSVDEPTPSYQQGVPGTNSYQDVQYLTPTDYENVGGGLVEPTGWNFNPTPSVQRGSGSGRAEPDLSTDADPWSGYLLYAPSFAQEGGALLEGGWGGTSFVDPQLNGSTAVIDAALGHRVGFWNPSIYKFATSPNSPFTPLNQAGTSNDNIFFTGNPGTVYNPATGLGVPNLTALERDFARG
ncbi:MAG: protease pro-enzyme activation domain-containing protein [Acidimicrobiales bacterium]